MAVLDELGIERGAEAHARVCATPLYKVGISTSTG